jgi:hypothetical protein
MSRGPKADKSKKKPDPKLQLEKAQLRESARKFDAVFRFLGIVARMGTFAFCAWCAKEGLEAMAGKTTSAIISGIFKVNADRWVAYAVSALCGVGYFRERNSKKKLIEQMGPYVKELEKKVDPRRTSSQLTTSGEASKEDRDGA